VVRLRIVHRPALLFSDPALIEQVLIHQAKHFVKHFGLRVFKPVLGNGLVTSEGDFWRRQRKLIAPAFVASRLAEYAQVMVEATGRMLESWREAETRDVHEDMMRLTLEIACRTFFSAEEPPDAEVVGRALYEGMHALGQRFRRVIPIPDWVPTPDNLRLRRSLRTLQGIVNRIVQSSRGPGVEESHDLLSTLLAARDEDGTGMSAGQLMDEVMTLLLAGHETTALALSYSLYLLAGHREAGRALREELSAVLGDRPPTWEDISRLKYTRRVVNEAMRLYPPADVLGREAIIDCRVGDVPVPRGTTVFMSQWVMHRDPRFFEDPLEFKPSRWTEELERTLPRFAYFPFGGGPRNCVGQNFAVSEAVLILAEVCRRYTFSPTEGFELALWPNITLRPRDGIPLATARIQ
jgi:cytochrome P450